MINQKHMNPGKVVWVLVMLRARSRMYGTDTRERAHTERGAADDAAAHSRELTVYYQLSVKLTGRCGGEGERVRVNPCASKNGQYTLSLI